MVFSNLIATQDRSADQRSRRLPVDNAFEVPTECSKTTPRRVMRNDVHFLSMIFGILQPLDQPFDLIQWIGRIDEQPIVIRCVVVRVQ